IQCSSPTPSKREPCTRYRLQFFFQAEDGIRGFHVTGVQTCALPIYDAVNFADSVLSFLEGASVVLGVLIALGAWMLRNSVQDQIAAIRAENAATQKLLAEREAALAKLEEDVGSKLDRAVEDTQREIDE